MLNYQKFVFLALFMNSNYPSSGIELDYIIVESAPPHPSEPHYVDHLHENPSISELIGVKDTHARTQDLCLDANGKKMRQCEVPEPPPLYPEEPETTTLDPETEILISTFNPLESYDGNDHPDYMPMLKKRLLNLKPKRKISEDYADLDEWYSRASKVRTRLGRHLEEAPRTSVTIRSNNMHFSTVDEANLQNLVDFLAGYISELLPKSSTPSRKTFTKGSELAIEVKSVNSSSEETSSEEEEIKVKEEKPKKERINILVRAKRNKKKPKRFEVVDSLSSTSGSVEEKNNAKSLESTEASVPLSEEVTKKPKKSKPRVSGRPETFMQSPGRIYVEGRDFRKGLVPLKTVLRRRLPQFLPKRYYWDPEEFQSLGYYWFNGPQGRDPPGTWKLNYK